MREGYILGAEGAVSPAMAERILAATYGTMAPPPTPLTGQSAPAYAADATDVAGAASSANARFAAAPLP